MRKLTVWIFVAGVSFLGLNCQRSASVAECDGQDTELCECQFGAGIRSCDETTGDWSACVCNINSATVHPTVVLDVDLSEGWTPSSTIAEVDTIDTSITADSEIRSETDSVLSFDVDTSLVDTSLNDTSRTSTDDIGDVDKLLEEYRDRVPDNFWMTIPDEKNGNNGLFHTIIDTDSDNDSWVWVDGYDISPLPQRNDDLLEMIYPDNGTVTNVGGRDALIVHARGMNPYREEYLQAIEASFEFEAPVDMSGEDYHVQFDVYLPDFIVEYAPEIQFALFSESLGECLYSRIYYRPASPTKSATPFIPAEEWHTIYGDISATGGEITYSGFERDPDDWILKSFRIRLDSHAEYTSIPGMTLLESSQAREFLFYVSNIKIWRD